MNRNECLKMLGEEAKRYAVENEERRKLHFKKSQSILNQWAKDNARFKVGDIICANDTIIKITDFYGVNSQYIEEKLYVTYIGQHLTKALKPRKDGSTMSIYDDGREVTKIA